MPSHAIYLGPGCYRLIEREHKNTWLALNFYLWHGWCVRFDLERKHEEYGKSFEDNFHRSKGVLSFWVRPPASLAKQERAIQIAWKSTTAEFAGCRALKATRYLSAPTLGRARRMIQERDIVLQPDYVLGVWRTRNAAVEYHPQDSLLDQSEAEFLR
jgi:hypothetical protein